MSIAATQNKSVQQRWAPEVDDRPYSEETARGAVAGKHLLSVRRANNPAQVLELKALLKAKGYDVGDASSGKFDEKVLAAVAQFQADNNLTKDGVVGQQTWAALLGVPGASKVPPGNDWLTEWNKILKAQGDRFVETAAPSGIDLRAGLTPENATKAPMFRQGDPAWGNRVMFNNALLRAKGCAITSLAMALSGATGKDINPKQLDEFLDKYQGYDVNNNVVWSVAGRAADVGINRVQNGSLDQIKASLEQKRPVVLGVDYKNSKSTDHWVAVTDMAIDMNGKTVFLANDPATGEVIRLYPNNQGGLSSYDGGMGNYRSTGDMAFITH